MLSLRLYLAQRISAIVMVPLVITHLGVMIYAVQDGLTAAEILSRTKGSVYWALFYGLFVAAASIHAAIGFRVIVHEATGLRGIALAALAWGAFAVLLAMGGYSVWAVTII